MKKYFKIVGFTSDTACCLHSFIDVHTELTTEKVIKTAIHEDYDDPIIFHDELSKRTNCFNATKAWG